MKLSTQPRTLYDLYHTHACGLYILSEITKKICTFITGVVKKPFPFKIGERQNNQFNIITFICGYSSSSGILAPQVTPQTRPSIFCKVDRKDFAPKFPLENNERFCLHNETKLFLCRVVSKFEENCHAYILFAVFIRTLIQLYSQQEPYKQIDIIILNAG